MKCVCRLWKQIVSLLNLDFFLFAEYFWYIYICHQYNFNLVGSFYSNGGYLLLHHSSVCSPLLFWLIFCIAIECEFKLIGVQNLKWNKKCELKLILTLGYCRGFIGTMKWQVLRRLKISKDTALNGLHTWKFWKNACHNASMCFLCFLWPCPFSLLCIQVRVFPLN